MDAVPPRSGIPPVWDIVQVDFPFADRNEVRRRPALVIAVAHVHDEFSLLWLAMITRASAGIWPFDIPISGLKSAGLLRPGVVRAIKVTSVEARLASRIGTLIAADRRAVSAMLRKVLHPVLTP
jgi:mRNA interferase MazF